MFTGIIEAVGKLERVIQQGPDLSLVIQTGSLDLSDVKLGDSIAVNGVCLTVTKLSAAGFQADVSTETLTRTALGKLQPGARVNLEKALLPTSRLGGHIVSGHVDSVAKVLSKHQQGRSWEFWISLPADIARYVAEKGSITVDGTSLTVNSVEKDRFRLTIIPHTVEETIIDEYVSGRTVNLEVDVIARYLERLIQPQTQTTSSPSNNVSMSLLAQSGFLRR